jgi:hypothetical protein
MLPANFNLSIYRGDTERWQFKLWTDTARTQAADLTGVTVSATIRDKAIGGTYSLALGCTVTLPNIVDMVLTSDQNRSLPITGGVWDLQLIYPSGDIKTVLKGTVVLTQDVTYSSVTPQLARARVR